METTQKTPFLGSVFMPIAHSHDAVTERYPTKYTRSVKVQISSGMNDVIDVLCTLLLRKYPSIDPVYEYTVLCFYQPLAARSWGGSRRSLLGTFVTFGTSPPQRPLSPQESLSGLSDFQKFLVFQIFSDIFRLQTSKPAISSIYYNYPCLS